MRNSLLPKRLGYLVAGFARAPPSIGPKILPIVHTNGITLKALGCRTFCGTISATVVRMIPTVPLLMPASALAVIAQASEREKPHNREVHIVQHKPSMIAGLRPN